MTINVTSKTKPIGVSIQSLPFGFVWYFMNGHKRLGIVCYASNGSRQLVEVANPVNTWTAGSDWIVELIKPGDIINIEV